MDKKHRDWRENRSSTQLQAEVQASASLEKVQQNILNEKEKQAQLELQKQVLQDQQAELEKEIEGLNQKMEAHKHKKLRTL